MALTDLQDADNLESKLREIAPDSPSAVTLELIKGAAAIPPRPDEDRSLLNLLPGLNADQFQTAQQLRNTLRAQIQECVLAPSQSQDRLKRLRGKMAELQIDGFIVPLNDEFHGEAAPACSERLKWLTGFTGSAGVAAVLKDQAAIFVDGRYTLQVQTEVDTTLFEPRHVSEEPLKEWLKSNMSAGETLAIDPWLHTKSNVDMLQALSTDSELTLLSVEENLIDSIWIDRPSPPLGMVVPQTLPYAGEVSSAKRTRIAATLAERNIDASVHTLPDVIAWLLNIRGTDLPCTPFALGFALLHQDATVDLFVDLRKSSTELVEHLGNSVRLHSREAFGAELDKLAEQNVLIDPSVTSQWILNRLESSGSKVLFGEDPCLLPKATKNEIEIDGTRKAHIRDGAAVSKFLHWLSKNAEKGDLDEMAAESQLRRYRESGENFRDLSFPTISGAGPNGAIVHYRATEKSNRKLTPGNLYLVDSGAQYLDGTTDITRTVAIGTPSEEMRHRFTLVLKGHIALAKAIFPKGTTGTQLDTLARAPLWSEGLDYDHGTGHGVGSYLSVHEGPQRISKAPSSVALVPGMILSNEPGYYKTDAYGIRIENLVTVREIASPEGAERTMYGFETLTFAPIDLSLIDLNMLTDAEKNWLDNYHSEVWEKISPQLDGEVKDWLEEATGAVS
ncbi:MAG: aminopeptidase P family protein [Proteobacteria bacterium]|nr:aminopeptidase P family protein [Pseudomonadota bacterium]